MRLHVFKATDIEEWRLTPDHAKVYRELRDCTGDKLATRHNRVLYSFMRQCYGDGFIPVMALVGLEMLTAMATLDERRAEVSTYPDDIFEEVSP